MATQSSKRSSKSAGRQAAAAAVNVESPAHDALRAVAGQPSRDLIPIPVLIAIFGIVWILIVWLMWPQFSREITGFMARHYVAAKKYNKAVNLYKSLIEDAPANPTWYLELGTTYSYLNKWDDARKMYAKAQENRDSLPKDEQGNSPNIPDFKPLIGLSCFMMGDNENALKSFQQALSQNKSDPLSNFTMGEMEFQKGNYPKAVEYFKVMARNPEYKNRVRDYYSIMQEKIFSAAGV
ncbi:MAG: tetratricopeptide repeat protein [bacterium]